MHGLLQYRGLHKWSPGEDSAVSAVLDKRKSPPPPPTTLELFDVSAIFIPYFLLPTPAGLACSSGLVDIFICHDNRKSSSSSSSYLVKLYCAKAMYELSTLINTYRPVPIYFYH